VGSQIVRTAESLTRRAHLTWQPDLLIRGSMCGRPDLFRTVRDLGRVLARCSWPSGIAEGRSPWWLPAWLPPSEALADRFVCRGPSAFQAGQLACFGDQVRAPLKLSRIPVTCDLRITRVFSCVARRSKARASFMFAGLLLVAIAGC
jgi:hypothetical protein